MNIDFAVALIVIGMSALILHFKSHVKFVALGVFLGLALQEIIPFDAYFATAEAEAIGNLVVVLIPAVVLGVNHTVDKRKGNFIWTLFFVLIFTLFFLSSIGQLLPEPYQAFIRDQSLIGFQVLSQFQWIALLAAVMILLDSIPHRKYQEKQKAKKSKKSKNSKKS